MATMKLYTLHNQTPSSASFVVMMTCHRAESCTSDKTDAFSVMIPCSQKKLLVITFDPTSDCEVVIMPDVLHPFVMRRVSACRPGVRSCL